MKIETYLNANDDARYKFYQYYHQYGHDKRERQYRAFRDRILRMDERNKSWVAELTARVAELEIQVVELEDVQNN